MLDDPGTGSPLFRYRFGSAEFDESRFELSIGGKPVSVQRKPLEVLALLLRHPGEVVTREELLEQVWENRPTVEHVINNALAKLRTALGDENSARIVTQPTVGYRFDGKLERTTVGLAIKSPLELTSGRPVPGRPNFILDRQLGRSQEHEVWLACHKRTAEQRVYKFCLQGSRLAGLKREATLARLLRNQLGSREDLVRLIDWNFDSPPYYLESEYCGTSLRDWCAESDNLARLDIPNRIGLFLQIADAVSAAHSIGVIHKDLKPANILVYPAGSSWRVKIADFGSGRLLNPDYLAELAVSRLGFTVTHHRNSDPDSGTPLYMAPELLAGSAATVQSDVYALGLMLYQLMVEDLHRPLSPGWERDIEDPLLRSDIARATDVDPDRRLPTVAQLAQSLRELDGRRQAAEMQERKERERLHLLERAKAADSRAPWVRSTCALLMAGITIAVASYWHARQSATMLQQQNEVITRLNRFLQTDIIGAANPETADKSDVTVATAVRSAAGRIDLELPKGPYAVRAALHASLQEAFSGLSDYGSAIDEGRLALRDFAAAGRSGNADAQLQTQLLLVSDLANTSRFEEADAMLHLVQGRITADTPSALRARAAFATGILESRRLRLDPAVTEFRLALSLLAADSEDQTQLRRRIRFYLGDALTMSGHYSEGEALFRTLIEQETQEQGTDSVRAEYTRAALAANLGYQKRFGEAIPLAKHAADTYQAAFGPEHRRTLKALMVLANLRFFQEQYVEAGEIYASIYERIVRTSGAQQDLAVTIAVNQAAALKLAGRNAQAASLLGHQLQIARTFLPENSPRIEDIRYQLADCNLNLHHSSPDIGSLLSGLDPAVLNVAQQEPDWSGRLAYQAGRLALYRGNRSDARRLLREALINIRGKNPDERELPDRIQGLLRSVPGGV